MNARSKEGAQRGSRKTMAKLGGCGMVCIWRGINRGACDKGVLRRKSKGSVTFNVSHLMYEQIGITNQNIVMGAKNITSTIILPKHAVAIRKNQAPLATQRKKMSFFSQSNRHIFLYCTIRIDTFR